MSKATPQTLEQPIKPGADETQPVKPKPNEAEPLSEPDAGEGEEDDEEQDPPGGIRPTKPPIP